MASIARLAVDCSAKARAVISLTVSPFWMCSTDRVRSVTVLIPAAYRCPDHDNQQAVTDGVRRLVEVERIVRL